MIIADVLYNEPVIGDAVLIECGDTLYETVITELTEDGVVVVLDEGILDRIKSLIPTSSNINDAIANKSLDSLGYLIGIATSRDESGSGVNILQRAATTEQFKIFYSAIELAQNSDPVKRNAALLAGIQRAQKDFATVDESNIVGLVKIAFKHLENGMRYIEALGSSSSASSATADRRTITKYGELDEAEYRGRKVPLGKPMKGDVKKSKVYVKKPNGTVVKVNFGDKNMRIKKSNPKRRKSFRARHNCANPGPRWKARYWSCRAW